MGTAHSQPVPFSPVGAGASEPWSSLRLDGSVEADEWQGARLPHLALRLLAVEWSKGSASQ